MIWWLLKMTGRFLAVGSMAFARIVAGIIFYPELLVDPFAKEFRRTAKDILTQGVWS